jgi:hypothetical protein
MRAGAVGAAGRTAVLVAVLAGRRAGVDARGARPGDELDEHMRAPRELERAREDDQAQQLMKAERERRGAAREGSAVAASQVRWAGPHGEPPR